jgi:NHLM bacteriocin system ABC transporter ATP-binding protein
MSAENFIKEFTGRRVAHEGHQGFWLDATDGAWLVTASAVDIFLQRRDAAGKGAGARHHVFRARAGQVFFGLDVSILRGDWALIAVPLPDATLYPCTTEDLQAAAANELDAAAIVALADAWVTAVSRGLKKPPTPKAYKSIGSVDQVHAEEHDILIPAQRVMWLAVPSGNALWLERYDSVINAASGPVPVPTDIWLKASGKMTVEAVAPLALLHEGRIWRALAEHHKFSLRYLLLAIDEALERESARLEDKANRSLIITRETMARLMSMGAGRNTAAAQRKQNTLLGACEIIGARTKIDFRLPAAAEQSALERDPVGTMSSAAKVRFRQVALRENWWDSDNGPLLASYADSKEWVALIPRGGKHYELHDPATGKVLPVDEDLAAKLSPFATMFYRVFPDKALTPLDVLRWGIFGLHWDIAMVIGIGVLSGGLGMLIPMAYGKLIDTFIPSADKVGILQVAAALMAAAVSSAMFDIARSIAVLRVETKMDGAVQAAVWDRVLKLPVPFFRKYAAGDLAMRINGVNTIRHALSGTTVSSMLTSIFTIFNFGLLFYYSGKLAAIASVLVVIAMVIVLILGYMKLRYERQLAAAAGKLSSRVFQYLSGISKLRVSSAEGRAFANWAVLFGDFRTLNFNSRHIANIEQTIFSGYGLMVTAVLFAAIGMFLGTSPTARLSTGEFIAFNSAFGTFFGGMLGLAGTVLGLLNLIPVYERAKPILETLPEVDENKSHPGELQGAIEVVKLGFSYGEGPDILKDVSFSIRPGGFIALVGPSGSGKSTLFRLMLGFEKPSSGSVYYDNQDINDLDVNSLRRQLGVVLQTGQLMAGDIFTNIVGTSQLTLENAWEAARMVGLEDDINQMPMGMHTVIGEGASTLSGGQRQRILIARAIVNKPHVLYFDEATSALDNRTQAVVSASLEQLKATRIVIAHRLSTVVNADRILVLQDGCIVQDGAFAKLMEQPGPFRDLANRQLA